MRVFLGRYPRGEKERKVNIRIDNYDLWSMDHTLSLIILPMLKKLKEITNELNDYKTGKIVSK